MKPYFEDESVTIYHGDCREILPTLPRADLIFADPPYGIGKAEWDLEFPMWSIPLMLATGSAIAITPGDDNFQRVIVGLGDAYRGLIVGHYVNGTGKAGLGFNNFIPVIIGGAFNRYRGQTAFDFSTNGYKADHPSPKPLVFMRWLVGRLCNGSDGGKRGELVIDPFMGSGTTLRAAKDLGIRAIGIEIEERYCEIAAKRMAQQVLPIYERVT